MNKIESLHKKVFKEAVNPKFRKVEIEITKFNRKVMSNGALSIYELNEFRKADDDIYEVGINIGSTGTKSVSDTEKRMKVFSDAIQFAKKINQMKIVKYLK